ncbi:MAG TPA: hypothetical protein VHL59_02215 [Thermoanaerobaculia bacterium]|nr:hypothetical protein [Thermoanaerobaculia bacterium]
MDMSLMDCWDCPVPLAELLLSFLLPVAIGAGAARLQRARSRALQAVGAVLIAIALLSALVLTAFVPNWGIRASEQPFDTIPAWATWLIVIALNMMLLMIIVAVRYWPMKRARV